MIKKIANLSQNKDDKVLFQNFMSLSILQGVNYILPLITLPYLIRVLGIEYFGLLSFATVLIMYFQILTDYGFNLSATKEISIHREDKHKIVEIFSAVMTIKIFLLFFSFILLTIIVILFERFSKDMEVYYLTFGLVVGQTLFPVWFFQGMEKMKYVTYLNILAKSIFTVSIFIFVTERNDYLIVPLLNSIGFIIVGVISLYMIKKDFGVTFKFQNKETITYYLVEGWHIFISRIYANIYTSTNIFVLGLFTNNIIVGHYAIAEKIVGALCGLFEPVNQTLYPFLAKKHRENKKQFFILIKKLSHYIFIASSTVFVLTYFFKTDILYLITGQNELSIEMVLSLLMFSIIIAPLGSFFSNILIIMHEKKRYMKVMNYTVLLNMIIVIPSIYFFQEIGLASSYLVVYISHVTLLYIYLNKSTLKGINEKK